MSHKHQYDSLILISVIPQIQDERGVLTLFNKEMGLIGYQCSIGEKTTLGGRLQCESVEPRYYLPIHKAREKFRKLQATDDDSATDVRAHTGMSQASNKEALRAEEEKR